jgi:uncharacterized protein YcbK (DUF882 family)
MRRRTIAAVFVVVLAASSSPAASSRFFFSGNGFIELHHAHFNEQIAVRYRDHSGQYDPIALQRIAHFFRSREDGAVGDVSLRLLELIDFVEDRARPERLVLISGYRSPEFNDDLRGRGGQTARASLHTEGMAVDLQPVGIDLRKLWIDLRDLRVGGVGYYAKEGFLHLDTGPPRFWEQTTSKVGENLAKGNARVFARTDFDRYDRVEGAVISLHQVTAYPIRIASHARVGTGELELEPANGELSNQEGCFVIARPAAQYQFRVRRAQAKLPEHGTRIRILTCSPRVEATAAEIETNLVESLRGAVP